MIHKQLHICEQAMDLHRQERGITEQEDVKEMAALLDKMLAAMHKLAVGVPKYRVGLCYFSMLAAFCDLMKADTDAIAEAKKHADKTGAA